MIYGCTTIFEIKNADDETIGYRVTHPTAFAGDNTHCDFMIMTCKGYEYEYEYKYEYKYDEEDSEKVVSKKVVSKKVISRKRISMGRNNISDIVESAGVITSFKEEHFCTDDENREYCTYTTEAE